MHGLQWALSYSVYYEKIVHQVLFDEQLFIWLLQVFLLLYSLGKQCYQSSRWLSKKTESEPRFFPYHSSIHAYHQPHPSVKLKFHISQSINISPNSQLSPMPTSVAPVQAFLSLAPPSSAVATDRSNFPAKKSSVLFNWQGYENLNSSARYTESFMICLPGKIYTCLWSLRQHSLYLHFLELVTWYHSSLAEHMIPVSRTFSLIGLTNSYFVHQI